MKIVFIVFLILISFSVVTYGGDNLPDYEPYTKEEFPGWANDLRRGEVILFGTIPFTFFLSVFLYDFYIYSTNNFKDDYAPAILGNKTPPQLNNTEKLQIIAVSVSFSTVLAFTDYLLGKPWNE